MIFRVVKEFRNVDSGAVMIVGSVIECDRDRAAVYFRHGLIGTIEETAVLDVQGTARIVPTMTATDSISETADDVQARPKRAGRPRKQD